MFATKPMIIKNQRRAWIIRCYAAEKKRLFGEKILAMRAILCMLK